MATTINEIIRDALEQIKAEHLNLTPDNYAKVFCKVAKQKGVIVEDCQKVDKYIKKLDPKIVADLKRFNVSSVDELLSFCVAKLNRANEGDAKAAEVKQAFLLQKSSSLVRRLAPVLRNCRRHIPMHRGSSALSI